MKLLVKDTDIAVEVGDEPGLAIGDLALMISTVIVKDFLDSETAIGVPFTTVVVGIPYGRILAGDNDNES